MRDEMGNLVWGLEKRVQGTSGEPLDRKFESNRLSTNQELGPPVDAIAARAFNYARDAQGNGLLWIGRRKTAGRGEGASGLRFDVIRRGRE